MWMRLRVQCRWLLVSLEVKQETSERADTIDHSGVMFPMLRELARECWQYRPN